MRAVEQGWQRWLNASGCTFTRSRCSLMSQHRYHRSRALGSAADKHINPDYVRRGDWGAKPSPAAETATSPASGRGDMQVAVPSPRLERRCCYANRFSAIVPSGDVFTS